MNQPWVALVDLESYGATIEAIDKRNSHSMIDDQWPVPSHAVWHAHRVVHHRVAALAYPEVHQANSRLYAAQQEPRDEELRARQARYDIAAVKSGTVTPGDVVEFRSGTIDCQGLKIEPLPDGEQRAAFAKYQDECIAALSKTLTLQQESQERAVAPNLQLPASSGSSDDADPTRNPAFLNILADASWVANSTSRGTFKLNKAQCRALVDAVGALQCSDPDPDLKLRHEASRSEVADLKRQLADARQLYANRDAADEELAAWQRETLAKAAAQFRAITGDFPGITGPLVDLFKDVKP